MRVFTVYEPRTPASADERAERTVFVKDGFSWLAFLFPLPWLLLNRLWLGTLIYLGLAVAGGLAGEFLPVTGGAGLVLALIANLYAGLEGNDLIRRKVQKRGFVHAGSVLAGRRDEAELLYFAQRGADMPDEGTIPAPAHTGPLRRREAGDVLGLFPQPEGAR